METIREIIRHLTMGYTVKTYEYILKMDEQGFIRDQNNNKWGLEGTDPNDYKTNNTEAIETLAKVSLILCDLLKSRL